jgi:SAM-dependent methyltransferase
MQESEILNEWDREGRPVPPPHIFKQRAVRSYAKRYGVKTLVETGTYLGDMVEAMKKDFKQVYSIELSKDLYEKAKERFDGEGNIELIHGDSATELGVLLDKLDHPALFWLDGHYSAGITARGEKDTPIYEELEHIFKHKIPGHVVLIDDAREFGTDPAYPSVEELTAFIIGKNPKAEILVEDDIIRITSK